ncbi:metabotropic glutamate receptor 1-like [Tachypleus tridentatus]|uniref:metabotropic glutamate receptor 1-like n=1 Tax=Tachypleus tridentatus TaxID=6853 RepID=UPI003FCFBA25
MAIPSPVKLQISAVLALLKKYDWTYVNVITTNDVFGRAAHVQFAETAKNYSVCIAETLAVNIDFTVKNLTREFTALTTDANVRVTVLLTNSTLATSVILEIAQEANLIERFTWVATEGFGSDNRLEGILINSTLDAFVVKLENHEIPEFRHFITGMTLTEHDPVPDSWFEEFWQHHFRCWLPSSFIVQHQYPDVCTGQERFIEANFQQDSQVYRTITTTRSIGRALRSLLTKHCRPFSNASNCEGLRREQLAGEIRKVLEGSEREPSGPETGSIFGYQVFKVQKNFEGKYYNHLIGLWKTINLTSSRILYFPTTHCRHQCATGSVRSVKMTKTIKITCCTGVHYTGTSRPCGALLSRPFLFLESVW